MHYQAKCIDSRAYCSLQLCATNYSVYSKFKKNVICRKPCNQTLTASAYVQFSLLHSKFLLYLQGSDAGSGTKTGVPLLMGLRESRVN